MRKNGLDGITVPVITPIRKEKVDYTAVSELIKFSKRSGAVGIFPAGSTGGAPLLDMQTHKDVISAFSEANQGLLFLPGIGRNSINETMEMANHAVRSGADAIVLVTPYYIKLSQESIFRYYDKIISRVDSQFIIYNIPNLTGNWINPETVSKLSDKHRKIIGMKESSGDFRRFMEYALELKNKIRVLQGQGDALLPALVMGAAGGVCGSTNFSDLAERIYDAFKRGDMRTASALQDKLVSIKKVLSGSWSPQIYNYLFFRYVMSEGRIETPEIYTGTPKEFEHAYKKTRRITG